MVKWPVYVFKGKPFNSTEKNFLLLCKSVLLYKLIEKKKGLMGKYLLVKWQKQSTNLQTEYGPKYL